MDVKYYIHHILLNYVVPNFSRFPLSSVTHIKFQLIDSRGRGFLDFRRFCMTLSTKCPMLKTLVLHYIDFTLDIQSVIDLCRQNLPNLEILSIRDFHFVHNSLKIEFDGHSKIKYLDIYDNDNWTWDLKLKFLKMSNLKWLSLVDVGVRDSWFQGDISFLNNLQVLQIRRAKIGSRTIQSLQNHAFNLTELYLCHSVGLKDTDFSFSHSVFPQLVTVCLRCCHAVTSEGIINFVRSCQSLQNVYVDDEMAESCAQHPFIVANESKLQIVKPIDNCMHYDDVNYLYDK